MLHLPNQLAISDLVTKRTNQATAFRAPVEQLSHPRNGSSGSATGDIWPFRQHPEHADGPNSPNDSSAQTACRFTLSTARVLRFPRRGARFLPQSRPTYATAGYNSHPLRGDPPSDRLSPLPQADVGTQCGKVPPSSLATERSVASTSGRPTSLPANGVSYRMQSLTIYRSQ
jgi:hypothetical protein